MPNPRQKVIHLLQAVYVISKRKTKTLRNILSHIMNGPNVPVIKITSYPKSFSKRALTKALTFSIEQLEHKKTIFMLNEYSLSFRMELRTIFQEMKSYYTWIIARTMKTNTKWRSKMSILAIPHSAFLLHVVTFVMLMKKSFVSLLP